MYCSAHGAEEWFYPETATELQTELRFVNVPLARGTSARVYREKFDKYVRVAGGVERDVGVRAMGHGRGWLLAGDGGSGVRACVRVRACATCAVSPRVVSCYGWFVASPPAASHCLLPSKIISGVRAFAPDLIIISCGFDAHKDDAPDLRGFLTLNISDYQHLTAAVKRVAAECCNGRLVSLLEGGYNLQVRRTLVGGESMRCPCMTASFSLSHSPSLGRHTTLQRHTPTSLHTTTIDLSPRVAGPRQVFDGARPRVVWPSR